MMHINTLQIFVITILGISAFLENFIKCLDKRRGVFIKE